MLETIKSPNWHLQNYFFSSYCVRDSGMEVIVIVVVESEFTFVVKE